MVDLVKLPSLALSVFSGSSKKCEVTWRAWRWRAVLEPTPPIKCSSSWNAPRGLRTRRCVAPTRKTRKEREENTDADQKRRRRCDLDPDGSCASCRLPYLSIAKGKRSIFEDASTVELTSRIDWFAYGDAEVSASGRRRIRETAFKNHCKNKKQLDRNQSHHSSIVPPPRMGSWFAYLSLSLSSIVVRRPNTISHRYIGFAISVVVVVVLSAIAPTLTGVIEFFFAKKCKKNPQVRLGYVRLSEIKKCGKSYDTLVCFFLLTKWQILLKIRLSECYFAELCRPFF